MRTAMLLFLVTTACLDHEAPTTDVELASTPRTRLEANFDELVECKISSASGSAVVFKATGPAGLLKVGDPIPSVHAVNLCWSATGVCREPVPTRATTGDDAVACFDLAASCTGRLQCAPQSCRCD